MEDRLSALMFLPPETGQKWRGHVHANLPELFYNDPPWHLLVPTAANALAIAIADLGVNVSAMLSDLSGDQSVESSGGNDPSTFHSNDEVSKQRSRIVPYRAERYGISPEDFDDASVIDFRLTVPRDNNGRYAYAPGQISRWESTPADKPLGGGSWIPAASFPPDVSSMQELSIKIQQLRMLSPKARVLVSMFPHRLQTELPEILSQKPDGILLRCTDQDLPPLRIAKFTQLARKIIDESLNKSFPLWVDASGMTPTDAAKLTHLGAAGVSIDSWCGDVFHYVSETLELSVRHQRKSPQMRAVIESRIPEIVKHMLLPYVNEFRGYCESMTGLDKESRIVATDPAWAKTLSLPELL